MTEFKNGDRMMKNEQRNEGFLGLYPVLNKNNIYEVIKYEQKDVDQKTV